MPDQPAPGPPRDWRDEVTYGELERLDRRGFAWEYLRRNPDYRQQRKPSGKAVSLIGGITVLRATAPALPPIWGLRFRGIPGHRRAECPDLLG